MLGGRGSVGCVPERPATRTSENDSVPQHKHHLWGMSQAERLEAKGTLGKPCVGVSVGTNHPPCSALTSARERLAPAKGNKRKLPIGLTLAALAVVSCSWKEQKNEGTVPAELRELLILISPEVRFLHSDNVFCNDRFDWPLDQGPVAYWTSRTPKAYDGILVDMLHEGGPNLAYRMTYFHWSVPNQLLMLFTHENVVMDPRELKWSTAVTGLVSAFVFKADGEPFAWSHFRSISTKKMGEIEDLVDYYRLSGNDLLEYLAVMEPTIDEDNACWFQDSAPLDSMLDDMIATIRPIDSTLFSKSESLNNPVIRRIVEARKK